MTHDGSTTVPLFLPFQHDGKLIEAIVFRAVDLGDSMDFASGSIPGTLSLMATLAGLSVEAIRKIKYPDATVVRERFMLHLPMELRDLASAPSAPTVPRPEPTDVEEAQADLWARVDRVRAAHGDTEAAQRLRDAGEEDPEEIAFQERQREAMAAGAHEGDDVEIDPSTGRPKPVYPDGYGARRPQDEDLSSLSLEELRARSGHTEPPGNPNAALGPYGKLFPALPPDYVAPADRPGAREGVDYEGGQGSFSVTDALRKDISGTTWKDPVRKHVEPGEEPAKDVPGKKLGLDLGDGK